MSLELREYQTDAVQNLRAGLAAGTKRQMLCSPTGSGKTEIGMAIVRGALAKNKKVAFLCNRIHLVNQTSRRFFRAGIDHGIIQGDNTTRIHENVLVASIQTVARRGLPDVDLLLIDEAHGVAGSKEYRKILMDMKGKPVIGLSATPYSKGLGKHYDELGGALFQDMIVAATIQELIDLGFLVDCDVYSPSKPDLSKVDITAGDYNEKQLGEAVDKPELIGDVVTQWRKHANGEPTVCFATNIAHSKHIVEKFCASGIRAEHIDCYTSDLDRSEILARVASGTTTIISNVGILCEGWDFPACKVLILARPTKSLIRYLQMAGRVLRPYPGKTCLARGTLVLTDKGNIEIQNVTLDHKVWDGHNFVAHDGAVCNGIKEVIEYDGLIATPDHEVMTNDGFKRFEEAASGKIRITRSGFGGKPIRVIDDYFEEDAGKDFRFAGERSVLSMRGRSHGAISQYEEKARYGSMPTLQWEAADNSSKMALPSMSNTAITMHKSIIFGISKLWGAWDRISFRWAERGRIMDFRKYWNKRQKSSTRQDQQQRPLRAGEHSMGSTCCECEQQQNCSPRPSTAFRFIQKFFSFCALCRSNVSKIYQQRNDGSRNSRSMGHSVMQAKREVWDILNAGPLQRFTANDRLVHNCALILDHSGTVESLGFPTDEFPLELDDGKPKKTGEAEAREQKERKPSVCPSCSFVKKTHKCPVCGFAPEKINTIEHAPGELKILTKKEKAKEAKLAGLDKQHVYSELFYMANEHGYKQGWIANKYREIFGVWPKGMQEVGRQPSLVVSNMVKASNIRFHKGRANGA